MAETEQYKINKRPMDDTSDDEADNEQKADNDKTEMVKDKPQQKSPPIESTEEVKKEESKETEEEKFPVQVFVRMRPLVGKEIVDKHTSIEYEVKKIKKKKIENLTLKKVYGPKMDRDKKYTGFKHVILPNCDNVETFNKCLLPTCIPFTFSGEKVCVFAYGLYSIYKYTKYSHSDTLWFIYRSYRIWSML